MQSMEKHQVAGLKKIAFILVEGQFKGPSLILFHNKIQA